MVEDNVIKLELKRVRDAVYTTADGVIGLEKEKMQMETAMKERREEIKMHVEMLRQQMKAADVERHNINDELHDRISRIDKLKTRFTSKSRFTHTHNFVEIEITLGSLSIQTLRTPDCSVVFSLVLFPLTF